MLMLLDMSRCVSRCVMRELNRDVEAAAPGGCWGCVVTFALLQLIVLYALAFLFVGLGETTARGGAATLTMGGALIEEATACCCEAAIAAAVDNK